jgi:hypothetical protein
MQLNFLLTALVSATLLITAARAAEAPYAGRFSDGTLAVDLSADASGYTGLITLGQRQFPTAARADGNTLTGTFDSGGTHFPYTAILANDTLSLITGGKTYTLHRVIAAPAPAPNPLGAMAPANAALAAPVSQQPGGSPAGNAPPGYDVLASSAMGQSLMVRKPGITSIKAALEAAFPELAQFFGTRPAIGRAYQDAKDPHSGGATFTVTLNGQPNQGFVKCLLDDSGASIAVIYGRINASKSDWDNLLKSSASGGSATAASDPGIPLKQYDFPDGTATIGLAEGWTTKGQSIVDPTLIVGPADQNIVLNNGLNINMPDSLAVKSRQQLADMTKHNAAMTEQNWKNLEKMSGHPIARPPAPPPMKPLPPLLVAPLLDPVEALKTVMPQMSALSQYNNGPTTTLDRIISSKEVPVQLPNGKGAEILYEYSQTWNGKTTHFRRLLRLMTAPLAQGTWFWFVGSGMAAPVATFDRDLPVMQAMVKSLKVDQEKANQASQAKIQQMQQAGQVMNDAMQKVGQIQRQMGQDDADTHNRIYQAQHQAQMDSYHQHNIQVNNQMWQQQRQAANVEEFALGSRNVHDTKTGQVTSVDLNYADGVAKSLNEATMDPNRFVSVPLRDELYPNPPPAPSR